MQFSLHLSPSKPDRPHILFTTQKYFYAINITIYICFVNDLLIISLFMVYNSKITNILYEKINANLPDSQQSMAHNTCHFQVLLTF